MLAVLVRFDVEFNGSTRTLRIRRNCFGAGVGNQVESTRARANSVTAFGRLGKRKALIYGNFGFRQTFLFFGWVFPLNSV